MRRRSFSRAVLLISPTATPTRVLSPRNIDKWDKEARRDGPGCTSPGVLTHQGPSLSPIHVARAPRAGPRGDGTGHSSPLRSRRRLGPPDLDRGLGYVTRVMRMCCMRRAVLTNSPAAFYPRRMGYGLQRTASPQSPRSRIRDRKRVRVGASMRPGR